jgi:MFS family permease
MFGWTDGIGIMLIVVAVVAAGILVWWEQRIRDPLISVRLMGLKDVVMSNTVGLVIMAAMAGSYLLLPFYLSMVDGYTTIQYGLILISNSIGMMISGLLVGKAIDRAGGCSRWLSIGCIVTAVGFFLFTTFGVGTPLWYVVLSLFVMGVGVGAVMVASTNLCYGYGREGEDGQLSGIVSMFRQAGSSVGVVVLNCIFVAGIVVSAGMPEGLIPGFRHAFFVAAVLCLVAFVISMSIRDKKECEAE